MIVIIGGSGFYEFIANPQTQILDTPFGSVEVEIGEVNGAEVGFISRHGKGHSILPSNINYRANIYAAHVLKAKFILASNAVGATISELLPGTFVLPDQILDFTHGRHSTFFDGSEFSIITRSGKTLAGVVHTDVSQPFDMELRKNILMEATNAGLPIVDGGIIAVTNGPRYETIAEINAYRKLGATIVGMTTAPEAFLAKEIEIPYATVAVVTNFAAGLQQEITHEEVGAIFSEKIDKLKFLFSSIISSHG